MTIRKRGKFWYGDSAADIRQVLANDYRKSYPPTVFADAVCECGGRVFSLEVVEDYGEVTWFCKTCTAMYLFHDQEINGYYEGEADCEGEDCLCPCDQRRTSYFEITVGAALYEDSEDVRWLYIGCRCVACGLTACYADWNRVDLPYPRLFANMNNKLKDD
jgi:hypothetical protein